AHELDPRVHPPDTHSVFPHHARLPYLHSFPTRRSSDLGHAGKWLEDQLSAEGVPGVFVWSHGENRSSLSVADHESGGTPSAESRSEEHTTELQSLRHLVCRLLPEKKNTVLTHKGQISFH